MRAKKKNNLFIFKIITAGRMKLFYLLLLCFKKKEAFNINFGSCLL
ncbi:hypothetical protein QQP08_019860 [Theobroma cacao]|nr:hypothetical protein QQP08_019860 [Theobroma cacao]